MPTESRHLENPPLRAGRTRTRFWVTLVGGAAPTIATFALLTAVLLPNLQGVLSGEKADGQRIFGMGTGIEMDAARAVATVVPAAGWWVEPQTDGGLFLRSPDGVLTVEMDGISEEVAVGSLEAAQHEGDPLLTETLASGLIVRHITTAEQFIAMQKVGDELVRFEAESKPPEQLAKYRVDIAELLESVASSNS